MKQIFFISLFILIGWEAECQQKYILIADETELKVTDKAVQIRCSNDTLPLVLLDKYGDCLIKYTMANKKVKRWSYKEYLFYWPIDKGEEITLFIKRFKR